MQNRWLGAFRRLGIFEPSDGIESIASICEAIAAADRDGSSAPGRLLEAESGTFLYSVKSSRRLHCFSSSIKENVSNDKSWLKLSRASSSTCQLIPVS